MRFKKHSSTQARKKRARLLICLICAAVLISGIAYTAIWLKNQRRIQREAELYNRLYVPKTPSPSAEPSATPSPTATSAPTDALPQVSDIPRSTPDGDTLVYALPTPPPVQDSFSELLEYNPETVGFLRAGDGISLPVVQRINDNEFYLNHTFAGESGSEGALFLDGLNRLVPEDDCLIVYGHNMHNGTMFGNLRMYQDLNYLRRCSLVSFDTLYRDGIYAPFAAFNASMDPGSAGYFDVRQFIFDADSFDRFVQQLRTRSYCEVPLDVRYGDRLLLLVTCDYTQNDGRFILALRAQRDGESAEELSAQVARAK